MEWIFWLSLGLVFYPYTGYPLLLAIVAFSSKLLAVKQRESKGEANDLSVSLVLVVHNEEARVLERIENLLQASYKNVAEVLVICDRCEDRTGPVAAATGPIKLGGIEQWVRVVELEKGRAGRAAGMNQAVAIAKGEIVVFADIGQCFEEDTVSHLVAAFADEKVGAVTGWVKSGKDGNDGGDAQGATRVSGIFLELDKMIREKESDFASTIGCARAVFAVRGDSYEAIADDALGDELLIPMKIALAGNRVVFASSAIAVDLTTADEQSELAKIKLIAPLLGGQWQVMWRHPVWLLPWVNGLSWQLLSHVYLRMLGPVLLFVVLFSNLALLNVSWFYWLCFFVQLACYGLAATGWFKVAFPWQLMETVSQIASEFLASQVLSVLALLHGIRASRSASKVHPADV